MIRVLINGVNVDVQGEYCEEVIGSFKFKNWVANLDSKFVVRGIYVRHVSFLNDKVRSCVFDVYVGEGDDVVGRNVFLRGGSVVILPVFVCNNIEYTVLTTQQRFAVGVYSFQEIPAGTMEEEDTPLGAAKRELREETELEFEEEKFVYLTEEFYGNRSKGVFSSPGGLSEYFHIFALRQEVDQYFLDNLDGRKAGVASENEYIVNKVIRLDRLPFEAPDAKSLCALMLYRTARQIGMI
jgi:8-oxo-dGTP pyrophosphatase MutT (NUDIX family)